MARRSRIRIVGSNNTVFLGAGSRLRGADLRLVGDDCTIFYGAFSSMVSALCIASAGQSIIIGEDCMLSSRIQMITTDSHGIYDGTTGLRINHDRGIVVGPDVWLGRAARVAKGCRIGAGTVLGEASLAHGTLEPGCVYAGVPARKIREGITWSRAAADDLSAASKDSVIRKLSVERQRFERWLAKAARSAELPVKEA